MNQPVKNCDDVRTRLSARYDGEGHGPGEALDRHLATCGECAAFERSLVTLTRGLAGLRESEPPTGLGARITAAVPSARAGERGGPWLLRAAAGVLGFLAIYAVARSREAYEAQPALTLFARATRALDAGTPAHTPPEQALLHHFRAAEDAR